MTKKRPAVTLNPADKEQACELLRERLKSFMAARGLKNTYEVEKFLLQQRPPIKVARNSIKRYLGGNVLPQPLPLHQVFRFLEFSSEEKSLLEEVCGMFFSQARSEAGKNKKGRVNLTSALTKAPAGKDAILAGKEVLRRCLKQFMDKKGIKTIPELSQAINIPRGTLHHYSGPLDKMRLPTSKVLKKLKQRLEINEEDAHLIRAASKASLEAKPQHTRKEVTASTSARDTTQHSQDGSSPQNLTIDQRLSQLEAIVLASGELSRLIAGNDGGRYNGSNSVRWQLRADNIQRLDNLRLTPEEISDTLTLLQELSHRFCLFAQSDPNVKEHVLNQLKPQLVELYTNVLATEAPCLKELTEVLSEQRAILNS